MTNILRLTLLTFCLIAASGCTVVKSWERGQLAKSEMAFDPDPMETQIKEHIYFAKEGSSSGSSVTGGGCGCN